MVNYRPAEFPRRPKQPTVLSEAVYQTKLWYYRYELWTGQYVMAPWEKAVYNIIFLSVFLLAFLGFFYYLPRSLIMGIHRLSYYITGTHSIHVTHVLQHNEQAASLVGTSPLNTSMIAT